MPMELIISSVGAALAAICYFCQAGAWRTQEIAAKAAPKLGVDVVNTFIGRNPAQSVDDQWQRFLDVWNPLIHQAEGNDVKVAIENCPMYFSSDEWPSGKNLAISPTISRRMFSDIESDHFGLNYDPSHLLWQQMDHLKPIKEFSSKFFHTHAKDAKMDQSALDEVGILATPLEYHAPRPPGRGDIDWAQFFNTLKQVGYNGAVCIEVEDRDYEETLEDRQKALRETNKFLRGQISN